MPASASRRHGPYLCRLRPIEVSTLTDANRTDLGVMTNRRKGSRDNIVRWTPRLRAAWDALVDRRARIWKAKRTAVPLAPEQRRLLVNEQGQPLAIATLKTAWGRLMRGAVVEGVIAPEERFGLHDLKRRGVTDTAGNRADKRQASGHRSEAMMDVYDLEVPVVNPAGERLFLG